MADDDLEAAYAEEYEWIEDQRITEVVPRLIRGRRIE